MNVELVELAAELLGPLVADVVFVGGATTALWITDPAAPEPRPTDDVDVIVEVGSRLDFELFEERLRNQGFSPDGNSHVICRYRHSKSELVLDAMPTDERLRGFTNRWYAAAVEHCAELTLPSGMRIRATHPVYLLATKIEAFKDRGEEDFVGSEDFEDIVRLIDGRNELVDEVRAASDDVRAYLAEELEVLRSHPNFQDGVASSLRPDEASQARAELVVLPRIMAMIET